MPPGLDAGALRRAMEVFAEALRQHRETLDSLNVFPVPDGDTGTNLLLTQSAVIDAVTRVDGSDLGAVCEAIGRASLMGARGNSGVILSQVLRALGDSMGPAGIGTGQEMAVALERAAIQARRAVARPVDGTMLSVLSDAAVAARRVAEKGVDAETILTATVEGARSSLARTTDQLPELRRAGVVDAGAKGIVLLLDALLAAVAGRAVEEPVGELGPLRHREPSVGTRPDLTFRFEVQCLVEAEPSAVAALRESLAGIGDSVVVVGGDGLYHVHVHTGDPGAAEAVAASAGRVRELAVADLAEQVAACFGHEARAVRLGESRSGLVAVIEGHELQAVFRSLGAVIAADRDDVIASIEASGRIDAIVLAVEESAIDDIVWSAVTNASETSGRTVRSLVAPSVPAALSAATAFNPAADLDRNTLDMEDAIEAIATGEVVETGAGLWVGRVGGEDVARNGSAPACLQAVIRRLLARAEDAEVLTIVSGPGGGDVDLVDVVEDIGPRPGGLRVQAFAGGPRGPAFAVGVE